MWNTESLGKINGTRDTWQKRSHALENEHKWLYDHPHNYQCKCQPDKEKGENDWCNCHWLNMYQSKSISIWVVNSFFHKIARKDVLYFHYTYQEFYFFSKLPPICVILSSNTERQIRRDQASFTRSAKKLI